MDVLNYMNETGTSSIDTAAIFNISSPGMIRNWRTKWNRCPTTKEKGASIYEERNKEK
jgi:hypothetical protein